MGKYDTCKYCNQVIVEKRENHIYTIHPDKYSIPYKHEFHYTRKLKPKYESRATRLSNTMDEVEKAKGVLEECKEKLEEIINTEDFTEARSTPESIAELNKIFEDFGKVSLSFPEIEALYDEVDSWASNIEEKFGNTQKYEMLDEARNNLDDVKNALEGAESNMPSEPKEKSEETIVSFCENLDGVIDSLQEAIDNASSIEFPGMYG